MKIFETILKFSLHNFKETMKLYAFQQHIMEPSLILLYLLLKSTYFASFDDMCFSVCGSPCCRKNPVMWLKKYYCRTISHFVCVGKERTSKFLQVRIPARRCVVYKIVTKVILQLCSFSKKKTFYLSPHFYTDQVFTPLNPSTNL